MSQSTRRLFMGAAGAAGGATYIDDVFSTYVYSGNNAANRSIVNGVDNTEGGLFWFKRRDSTGSNVLSDSVTGINKILYSDLTDAQVSPNYPYLSSLQNNGFTLLGGTNSGGNVSGREMASWNFRKAPGFFDIVTYTGNGTAGRTIAHNLGSVPGMVIIKCLNENKFWAVGHRSLDYTSGDYLRLNTSNAVAQHIVMWNDTAPTSTHVTLGTSSTLNKNGNTYVAYLFAGGASTAATARSVELDGNDEVEVPSSTDFDFGSGDFTMECWVKHQSSSGNQVYLNRSVPSASSNSSWLLFGNTNGNIDFYATYSTGWSFQMSAPATVNDKQWHHIAVVREGTNIKIYFDGTLSKTQSIGSNAIPASTRIMEIGSQWNSALFTGKISNVRIVKGTAVYTSSFKPSTEPLTNITNTKLLCCNNSSVTGATVTPGALTTTGDPTASTNSPFDDPEGFQFGEEGDQNIIKCDSFQGTGSNQKIYLGFEPQWFLWKQSSSSSSWIIFDSMRGIVSGGNDAVLYPESSGSEVSAECISLDPDGVTFKGSAGLNPSGHTLIYMAIRRPDGYVGKPPKVGTDVFTQAYGANSGDFRFTSNFPVDFGWAKLFASSGNWWTSARLIQQRELKTNNNDAEGSGTNKVFDSNTQWHSGGADSTYISHMWKRHAGFDVVTYTGNGVNRTINHSLGRAPEMMWLKIRNAGHEWIVWHKGLNGGTNSYEKSLYLNDYNAEFTTSPNALNNTLPASSHFSLSSWAKVNSPGDTFISMLFASVDGISKCGSYAGQNSGSSQTITTGFQPRFLIIKSYTNAGNWLVYDTTRGWAAGNDQMLWLDDTQAQEATEDLGNPISTGFTINGGTNASYGGRSYMYYAHA